MAVTRDDRFERVASDRYHLAVQQPGQSFEDARLRRLRVARIPGTWMLDVSAGGFADVFRMVSPDGGPSQALRCFHKIPRDIVARYQVLEAFLRHHAQSVPGLVTVELIERGVRAKSNDGLTKWWPVTLMPWVEGLSLGQAIADAANEGVAAECTVFRDLADRVVGLANTLEAAGIVHGDIQPENIIVNADGALTLVDYDGMRVPGLDPRTVNEVGRDGWQHPQREAIPSSLRADRFSFAVLWTTLNALSEAPDLYERAGCTEDTLILSGDDLRSPRASRSFTLLAGVHALREHAEGLVRLCEAPIDTCPALTDFIAGRALPARAPTTAGRPASIGWRADTGPSSPAHTERATRPPSQVLATGAAQRGSASAAVRVPTRRPTDVPVIAAADGSAVRRAIGSKVALIGQVERLARGPDLNGHADYYMELSAGGGGPVQVGFSLVVGRQIIRREGGTGGIAIGDWISVTGSLARAGAGVAIRALQAGDLVRLQSQTAAERLLRPGSPAAGVPGPGATPSGGAPQPRPAPRQTSTAERARLLNDLYGSPKFRDGRS